MEPIKKPVQPFYMPQMTNIPYKFICDNLNEFGIQHEPINVSIGQLKPLQQQVDLNKVQSLAKVEDDDNLPPIWIARKGHILDGHHRSSRKKFNEGDNGRIRAIRIDADEKDGAAYLKIIQDRWERSNKSQ